MTGEATVRELVAVLTEEFRDGRFDLSGRRGAPPTGWESMPEHRAAESMRAAGADDVQVRLALTFGCAMDRARDADLLWDRIARLFLVRPSAFDPGSPLVRTASDLSEVLRTAGVSQRHGPDSAAWLQIARSLHEAPSTDPIHHAMYYGIGSATELLRAVRHGTSFPLLRGPKIAVMWVRMLAWPGGASISGIEALPVAVDTQVKKVSEYLGVTETSAMRVGRAKAIIQDAWRSAAAAAVGPEPLAGTGAALDPALWFFGKWGCTFCERAHRRQPISEACRLGCRFVDAL